MSVLRGIDHHGPPPLGGGMSGDPVVGIDQMLDRFRRSTEIRAADDLLPRMRSRLSAEPRSTAPRRFVAALRALSGPGIWRGFIQSAGAAFSPGTRSMALRMQALAVVFVVIAATGAGSVAAVAAVARVVTEVRGPAISDQKPSHQESPSRPSDVTPQGDASRIQVPDGRPITSDPATSEVQTGGQPAAPIELGANGPSALRSETDAPGQSGAAPQSLAKEKANKEAHANEKAGSVPNRKANEKTEPQGKTDAPGQSGATPPGLAKEKANPKTNEKAESASNGKATGKTDAPGQSGAVPAGPAKERANENAANANANANANQSANGNGNENGNANANGNENGNANANGNENGNGNANGNANGNGNADANEMEPPPADGASV